MTSLAWSAAEHAPDHPWCLCSLPAVDARRHPGRRGAFDVYSCHTCSLYGLICSHILSMRTMCFSRQVRLLLIVIAACVSVSAETHKPIYRIRRYCKATSEYSPIRSIGLTLLPSSLFCCVKTPTDTERVIKKFRHRINTNCIV